MGIKTQLSLENKRLRYKNETETVCTCGTQLWGIRIKIHYSNYSVVSIQSSTHDCGSTVVNSNEMTRRQLKVNSVKVEVHIFNFTNRHKLTNRPNNLTDHLLLIVTLHSLLIIMLIGLSNILQQT